jgi:hypothetical protein
MTDASIVDQPISISETLPEGASKTGTPVDSLNPINRAVHNENVEKLKQAAEDGIITLEQYNKLSAFDATKTMGLGPITGTAAAALYQGTQSLGGALGINEGLKGFAEQSIPETIADTARNIQGVSGNITPEEQVLYQEIVTGQKIFRDPILGMVQQPDTGTLAGEPGLPDIGGEADIDLSDAIFGPGAQLLDYDEQVSPGTIRSGIEDDDQPTSILDAPVLDIPDRGRGTIAPSPPPRDDDAGMPEAPAPDRGPPTGISGPPSVISRPPSDDGGGGGGGCFLKGTQVTMADGSTKAIEQVDLGDNVAKGGKVFATGKFLVDNLHDYKGIKVSGSHMVYEDNKWVRVKDSKHGKSLGDDEHIVYVFGAENRRILINDILFTDYFEVKEQEKLVENEKYFFKNWKKFSNEHNESNVNILNAS